MADLFTTTYPNNIRLISGLFNVPYQDDSVLNCNTALGAVAIQLLEIPADYFSTQYKLYINDFNTNASVNNITITAPLGFFINGASSVVINTNGGSALVRVSNDTNYIAQLSSSSGGSGITSLPVKNTVYVMKNGNDTTGLVERFDKPFLTIISAVNAIRLAYPDGVRDSFNRVRVIVEDGTYYEATPIILYAYVDFDFGNSNIYASFTTFNSGVYGANPYNNFTTKIFGNASLFSVPSPVIVPILIPILDMFTINNVDSRVLIQCDNIFVGASKSAIVGITGYAKFICNKIENVSVLLTNIDAVLIKMNQVGAVILNSLRIDIQDCFINNNFNPLVSTISFYDQFGDQTSTLSQTLNLYNCTACNTSPKISDSAQTVVSLGSNYPCQVGSSLNLYNSVLYSATGRSILIDNVQIQANLIVNYFNSNSANRPTKNVAPIATRTLVQNISTLLVDSNVIPLIP